jgi:hypothetical protein
VYFLCLSLLIWNMQSADSLHKADEKPYMGNSPFLEEIPGCCWTSSSPEENMSHFVICSIYCCMWWHLPSRMNE